MSRIHSKQRAARGAGGQRVPSVSSGAEDAHEVSEDTVLEETRADLGPAPDLDETRADIKRAPDLDETRADLGPAPAPPGGHEDTADEQRPVRSKPRDKRDTQKIGVVIDGRYRITGLIGRGGMGSVYRAEHIKIHRTVAMKLLHPTLAKIPEVSQRFEREAFAIGRIEHDNCVNVSDFGQLEDGSLYLVMEYLEGRALGDVLAKERRVEPVRTMRIIRHVLRGLGHAHQHGIVHRDVKPENVLLIDKDGDTDFAKILDFGIAKLVGRAATDVGGSKLTQAGVAFGTPIYMSPEQAVGNPVDGRADLYAASIMAYEMITGKPPFDSDDKLEVMSMHTTKPPPPFAHTAPDVPVPPAVEQVIMRGLAKRPEDRYADADDFIAAIDDAIGRATGSHELPAGIGGDTRVTADVMTLGGGSAGGSGAMPHLGGPGMSPGSSQAVGIPPAGPGGSQGVMVPPPGSMRPGTGQPVYPHATPYGMLQVQPPSRMPSRRRRLLLVCAAAVVAIAGVTLALVLTRGGGDDDEPAEPPLAERAAELIGNGDPKGAIELLEAEGEALAAEPAAQLQLGHAYAFTSAERKALAAYRTAIAVDAALATDASLRSNLEVMLGDKKQDVPAVEAAEFVLSAFPEDDALRERSGDKLVEIASKAKDTDARVKARELAERYELDERVDRLKSFLLDLVYGKSCDERAQAIPKLRALGDPKAIRALKRAPRRKGRYGKWRGKPVNLCLKEAATEAAQYLETLAANQEQQDSDAGVPEDEEPDAEP